MTSSPEVIVVGDVGVDTNVYLHAEIDFSVGPTSLRGRITSRLMPGTIYKSPEIRSKSTGKIALDAPERP